MARRPLAPTRCTRLPGVNAMVGREFEGYRIEAEIGRGGQAVVYRATQMSLQRTVALKVVSPQLSSDANFKERFTREGIAAYCEALATFEKALTQRNALLKRIGDGEARPEELAYWNEQLAQAGGVLVAGRQRLLRDLEVRARRVHRDLSGGEEDLELFWQALINMFEHDRSAARGQMSARKLIVFKHDGKMGNAPAHSLFDLVTAEASEAPVRSFDHYDICVPTQANMPQGVTVIEKL